MAYKTAMGAADRRRRKIKLWEKQGRKCKICKISITLDDARLDHKRPVSKGGTNNLKNLQVLCPICDYEKADSWDGPDEEEEEIW
jgi:5-methylcytosine-specific restriction endonuclease McrA